MIQLIGPNKLLIFFYIICAIICTILYYYIVRIFRRKIYDMCSKFSYTNMQWLHLQVITSLLLIAAKFILVYNNITSAYLLVILYISSEMSMALGIILWASPDRKNESGTIYRMQKYKSNKIWYIILSIFITIAFIV